MPPVYQPLRQQLATIRESIAALATAIRASQTEAVNRINSLTASLAAMQADVDRLKASEVTQEQWDELSKVLANIVADIKMIANDAVIPAQTA